MRRTSLLVVAALLAAGCSTAAETTTTTSQPTTTTTVSQTSTTGVETTTTPSSTTTTTIEATTTTTGGLQPVGEPRTDPYQSDGFPGTGEIAFLVDVRLGRHGDFDRVVFEFDQAIPEFAIEYVEAPIVESHPSFPPEVRSLGRTLTRWKDQIVAWHQGRATNGPTEAINNLIKRIKRIAFGFRRFRAYRIRALLYAGNPNWELLATVTPR